MMNRLHSKPRSSFRTSPAANAMDLATLSIELDKLQRQTLQMQSMLMGAMGYQTVPSQGHSNAYIALRNDHSYRPRDGAQSRYEHRTHQAVHSTPSTLNPEAPEWFPSKETPHSLNNVLRDGDEVVVRVIIGKHADGYPHFTTAITTFEKGVFTVTSCEFVESLVGKTFDKPGTLLYRFMDGLIKEGKIRRRFRVAPWKLCFVKRDGVHTSLNELVYGSK